MVDLVSTFELAESSLGHLTSAIQFGFIGGTLVFALLSLVDRYSPSKVFFVSALLGAVFNLGIIWGGNTIWTLLLLRFLTGFFLAGIYPVGMKIATDYFEEGLGKSLGFLVGALVLGTAFPHVLATIGKGFPWTDLMVITSVLAALGGLLMLILVPNGPYRKQGLGIDLSASFRVFKDKDFRVAAYGYFGHMWELYAFWAFVPVMLASFNSRYADSNIAVPLWSFIIIGVGGIACVAGGYIAAKRGTKKVASTSLLLSGLCCLCVPLIFAINASYIFISFMLFWGMVVIADSPLFSTLVAHNAPSQIKGTALTIVNCIGFSVTIISIQLLTFLRNLTDSDMIYMILVLGPFLGLLALYGKRTSLG